jgi:hypothetical protein
VDLVVEDHRVANVAKRGAWDWGIAQHPPRRVRRVFPTATVRDLACRVYPTPAGGLDGPPPVASLVEALRPTVAHEPPASAQ